MGNLIHLLQGVLWKTYDMERFTLERRDQGQKPKSSAVEKIKKPMRRRALKVHIGELFKNPMMEAARLASVKENLASRTYHLDNGIWLRHGQEQKQLTRDTDQRTAVQTVFARAESSECLVMVDACTKSYGIEAHTEKTANVIGEQFAPFLGHLGYVESVELSYDHEISWVCSSLGAIHARNGLETILSSGKDVWERTHSNCWVQQDNLRTTNAGLQGEEHAGSWKSCFAWKKTRGLLTRGRWTWRPNDSMNQNLNET